MKEQPKSTREGKTSDVTWWELEGRQCWVVLKWVKLFSILWFSCIITRNDCSRRSLNFKSFSRFTRIFIIRPFLADSNVKIDKEEPSLGVTPCRYAAEVFIECKFLFWDLLKAADSCSVVVWSFRTSVTELLSEIISYPKSKGFSFLCLLLAILNGGGRCRQGGS